jgi:general transcription factor 3C polypeptide 3 (transcription factor C subunit 4)
MPVLQQESMYNLGRAYQQLGLVHLAVPYYESIIALHLSASPAVQCQNMSIGYFREASYNLSLVYRASGSFELAREVLRRIEF